MNETNNNTNNNINNNVGSCTGCTNCGNTIVVDNTPQPQNNFGISKKRLDELLSIKPFTDTFAIRRASLRKVETINTTITGRRYKEKNGIVEEIPGKTNGYVVNDNPDTDCCEVVENLYIGSQDAAAEEEILDSKGITHIVNVGSGIPNMFEKKIKYFKVEILDTPEFDILPYIEPTSNFIDQAISKEHGKVLVHCNAGVSRSSAILIGYLMSKRGYSYEEALEKTKKARSCVCPNFGFAEQLRRMNRNIKDGRNPYEPIITSMSITGDNNLSSSSSSTCCTYKITPSFSNYNRLPSTTTTSATAETSNALDKIPLSSISETGDNQTMYLVNEEPLEIEKIDISRINMDNHHDDMMNDEDILSSKTV